MMLTALAGLALATWVYLLVGRSGFWRADQRLGDDLAEPESWPAVVAVVPARNEAAGIAACLEALAAQDYPGRLDVIAVNDASTDDTAGIARRVAGETAGDRSIAVLDAPPLAAGWAGKLWALDHGVAEAARRAPDAAYLWFTDADIVHQPRVLRALVAKARGEGRALVSLMVRLNVSHLWEALLVPAFVFFFQMLYPFPAVNDPRRRVAAAAGGCVLVAPGALAKAGGISAIRDALIDDCALAASVKRAGGDIWLGLGERSTSIRPYAGLAGLWAMVKRSAFTQLNHSTVLLIGTVVAMVASYLVPPFAVLAWPWHGQGTAAVLGGLAWGAMMLAYAPTLAYYRRPIIEAAALPLTAALYISMTMHSAFDHWRGRGGRWKGRTYTSAES